MIQDEKRNPPNDTLTETPKNSKELAKNVVSFFYGYDFEELFLFRFGLVLAHI